MLNRFLLVIRAASPMWGTLAAVASIAALLWANQSHTKIDQKEDTTRAQTATGALVAPNIMIVMANGFSMGRELSDSTYPPRVNSSPVTFVDINDNTKDLPIEYDLVADAEAPTSKFFLAKQALAEIATNDTLSANVNFGFATWRTAYNQARYVQRGRWQFVSGTLYPNDRNILSAPTPDRYAYAGDAQNFKAISVGMYPETAATNCPTTTSNSNTSTRAVGAEAIIGKNLCDGGKNVIRDSDADYMTALGGVGGLPLHVTPNHLRGYRDVWAGPTPGKSQNDYSPNNLQSLAGFYFDRTQFLPTVPSNSPPNRGHFCGTGYSSEANSMYASYVLEYSLPGGMYSYEHDFRDSDWPASNVRPATGSWTCAGATVANTSPQELLSKAARFPDGTVKQVDQAYVPSFYTWAGKISEMLSDGAISGWSGENVLLNGGQSTETLTATYPSGPASTENASVPGRQLRSKGLVKNGVKHMGPFLDLPDPAAGYVDQREIILGFVNPVQMDASGLEYDPVKQQIAPDASGKSTKGIRASDSGGDGQSPVYDSLFGALAYYDAYKKADPYTDCRSNHVLLLYDGKENSRYFYDASIPGGRRFADPAEVSKRLLDEQGVFTHVVIISGVAGDISEANRIANAGGTKAAYVIGAYTELQAALRSVFGELQKKVFTAPVALPVFVRNGDTAYAPLSFASPSYGTLEARTISSSGSLSTTAAWDTNNLMTAASRAASLYSTDAGAVTQFSALPNAAFATGASPTADEIRGYTIDPNYGAGIFLSGRKSGELQGVSSSMNPLTVESVMSPELATTPGYIAYATGLPIGAKLVLYSSNDGFLYAVGQVGGQNPGIVRWGWMPSTFLPRLKSFATFQSTRPMDGELRVLDVKLSTGFHRVVIGTVNKGLTHFGLVLKADGGIDRVLWEDEHPLAPSDALSAPQVVRSATGTFAFYIRGDKLRSVDLAIGAIADRDLSSIGPAGEVTVLHMRGAIGYLGTEDGRIFEFDAASTSAPIRVGTVEPVANRKANKDSAVRYITSVVKDDEVYVIPQNANQITALKRSLKSPVGTAMTRVWRTYNGGAEGSGVQPLVASARISAPALVVEGVVFLPVTVDGSSNKSQCLAGRAEMHFLSLDNGKFPDNRVVNKETGEKISGPIILGSGDSLGSTLIQFGDGELGAVFSAQAAGERSSGSGTASVRDSGTRLVWWKEKDRVAY